MKNVLLLLTFICLATASYGQCEPDTTLPDDFIGISPLADSEEPCDTLVPEQVAYIGEEYSTVLTVFVPEAVSVITIDSISINPADDPEPGIVGLPDGMTYSCFPESCVFPGGEPGCVELHGTPTDNATVEVHDLQITATLNSQFANGDIRFPLPEDEADYNNLEQLLVSQNVNLPECPYQIMVYWNTSTQDLFEAEFSMGQNNPNPFTGETSIPVTAKNGDYTFAVYNSVGKLVHSENLQLEGRSNVPFDASNLESGVYFYTFSNENGSTTKRMLVK